MPYTSKAEADEEAAAAAAAACLGLEKELGGYLIQYRRRVASSYIKHDAVYRCPDTGRAVLPVHTRFLEFFTSWLVLLLVLLLCKSWRYEYTFVICLCKC